MCVYVRSSRNGIGFIATEGRTEEFQKPDSSVHVSDGILVTLCFPEFSRATVVNGFG